MPEQPGSSIERREVLLRILRLLAEISGRSPDEIKVDFRLSDDPLNYSSSAKMALAGRLEALFEEFGMEIAPGETASCEVVRDLRILVERKMRDAGVEIAGLSIFQDLE
jgi:acyl carrier protein